ncbi:hypothetical protein QJQ45_030477 [Haematococcus lacustris]|nr:hypothetical protein QJQ45_030477 [Haematococcus lacustris]
MNWWPEAFPCRAAYAAVGLATRDYISGKHGVLGCFEDQHQTHTSPRLFQAAVQPGYQPWKTVSWSPAQPSPAQPSPAQPSPAQPSLAQPTPAQPTPAR